MNVERKRNGKGEKRGAEFGREVDVPTWADSARGRGSVSVTVVGNASRRSVVARRRERHHSNGDGSNAIVFFYLYNTRVRPR